MAVNTLFTMIRLNSNMIFEVVMNISSLSLKNLNIYALLGLLESLLCHHFHFFR